MQRRAWGWGGELQGKHLGAGWDAFNCDTKRGGRQMRSLAAFQYLESYLWRREQTGSVDTQG